MFNIQDLFKGFEEKPEAEITPVEGVSPDINPYIQTVLDAHINRLGVEPEEARKNALEFATYVGFVENSGETYGRNIPEEGKEASSASGLYQFLTDDSKGQSALQTAINRTKKYVGEQPWLTEAFDKGEVEGLTRNQQTALFLGDMLEQKGGDEYMKPILEGDRSKWVSAYKKMHYRGNTTNATNERADKIFKQMNVEVIF